MLQRHNPSKSERHRFESAERQQRGFDYCDFKQLLSFQNSENSSMDQLLALSSRNKNLCILIIIKSPTF